MAIVQSTYANIAPGAHGTPATMVGWDADTKIVETAAGIGFGLAVSRGTDKGKQIVVGGTVADYCGVTYRDITLVSDTPTKYLLGDNAGVAWRGDIWLIVPSAVVVGGPVTFVTTTGVISGVAADATNLAIPGARWMRPAGIGGVALLRLGGSPAAI